MGSITPKKRSKEHSTFPQPVAKSASSSDFAHAIVALAVLALLALLAFLSYSLFMATIVIRNLDESVKRKLQVRAALNGRSMEAEARAALNDLLEESPTDEALPVRARRDQVDIGTAIHRRFAALGGVDLKIPPRTFSTRKPPKFDE